MNEEELNERVNKTRAEISCLVGAALAVGGWLGQQPGAEPSSMGGQLLRLAQRVERILFPDVKEPPDASA